MTTKYHENDLLPKITNEVTLKHSGNNPRTSLWQTLYKNNPDNYWCNVFVKRMSEANIEEIKFMIDMGTRLEEELSVAINKNVDVYSEDAKNILGLLIKHLEFFHKMDEHFYDTVIELCERAHQFDKKLIWLDMLISENPNFLKENPLVGMLSTKYNMLIHGLLVHYKESILKGDFSVK